MNFARAITLLKRMKQWNGTEIMNLTGPYGTKENVNNKEGKKMRIWQGHGEAI